MNIILIEHIIIKDDFIDNLAVVKDYNVKDLLKTSFKFDNEINIE